jgi:hypothetical protein
MKLFGLKSQEINGDLKKRILEPGSGSSYL